MIIIGYSLPETDTSFKLYFKSAFINNVLESTTKILKIDIVNYIPYSRNREIFEEKYKEIIESVNNVEGVNGRVIISFIYKRFSDYINDDLNLSTYTHNKIKNKTIG